MSQSQHLVLVTSADNALEVVASWQRILPEDDLPGIRSNKGYWKSDVVYTFSAQPKYIEALVEIIDQTLPDPQTRLMMTF